VHGRAVHVRRVRNSDAVAIIPILGGNKIIMEKQYRPVVKKWLYELPAGHVEPGEDVVETAKRELKEETGYEISKIKFLFKSHTDVSVETQMQYVFLAECKPRRGTTKFDPDEKIRTIVVPISKAIKMIKQNTIQEHTTLGALSYFLYFYKRH
jgi:ADP-ribose pyrophosphatase